MRRVHAPLGMSMMPTCSMPVQVPNFGAWCPPCPLYLEDSPSNSWSGTLGQGTCEEKEDNVDLQWFSCCMRVPPPCPKVNDHAPTATERVRASLRGVAIKNATHDDDDDEVP